MPIGRYRNEKNCSQGHKQQKYVIKNLNSGKFFCTKSQFRYFLVPIARYRNEKKCSQGHKQQKYVIKKFEFGKNFFVQKVNLGTF